MNTAEAPKFIFWTKVLGEEFLRKLRQEAYKYDVVTLNDILKERGGKSVRDGYRYGYSRAEIKKLKLEKVKDHWEVKFPTPGKIIQDKNGYWTTEAASPEGGD